MVPFDGKCSTSYLMAIVMFALSLTVYEIFANLIIFQNIDLEMKVKEWKNETYAIRLKIFDSI